LGLSFSAFGVAQRVIAGEPLPDASVVAYRGRPPAPPPQPKVSEVTLTGVVKAVQSNGLKIKASKTSKSKDQKDWFVLSMADTTEFTIRGTATADYLHSGQIVIFSGQIVKDEKAAEKAKEEKLAAKVDESTIISRKGGVSHLKKGDAKDQAAAAGGGRVTAPASEADPETDLAASDSKKPKADHGGAPAAKSKAASGSPEEKILGRIATCDEKSLTVTSGQRTIHVDLAETPTIHVVLSDPKLIPNAKDASKSRIEGKGAGGHVVKMMVSDLVGAKIVVHGTGVESKSGNECMAKSIKVTLAKPLAGDKHASPDPKKTVAEK
jgi:hypothetical protein